MPDGDSLPIPKTIIPRGHSLAARWEDQINQANEAFFDEECRCVFCGQVDADDHEIVIGYVADLTSTAQEIKMFTRSNPDGSTSVCWKRKE